MLKTNEQKQTPPKKMGFVSNLTTTATLLGSPLLLHSYRRLAYNGGTTETMLPLTGSPALGAGLSSTLPTDQRGDPQPTGSGAVSDLGSVEVTP